MWSPGKSRERSLNIKNPNRPKMHFSKWHASIGLELLRVFKFNASELIRPLR